MQETNWARNIHFLGNVKRPKNLEEVRDIVSSGSKIRGVGSRHSFNRIAESSEVIIDSLYLPKDIEIDSEANVVRVSSGIPYGLVGRTLEAQGLALRNLGSLPHISVVGATSTGTHGSGMSNQNLSSAIVRGELILASGEEFFIWGKELDFLRISLGSLGFIHHLYLETVPSYMITQYVYVDLPLTVFLENLVEIFSVGYSVSVFHIWGYEKVSQIWVKSKESSVSPLLIDLGAKVASEKCHPIPGAVTSATSEQMGKTGPWNEVLPHFKFDQTPSVGDELQSEYFIPLENAREAIAELDQRAKLISPMLLVSEFRTVLADKVALSPAFERSCIAIHFTWKRDELALISILPVIESILKRYGARPHPGKVFTSSNFQFSEIYSRFGEFTSYRDQLDPNRKFINNQLELWGF